MICKERHTGLLMLFAGRDKRPVVEFALESAQAVRKMASKQAWQKAQAQGHPPPTSLTVFFAVPVFALPCVQTSALLRFLLLSPPTFLFEPSHCYAENTWQQQEQIALQA